jgi:hypothetical protein
MPSPAADIFDGERAPASRSLGIAPFGQHAKRQPSHLPELVPVGRVRAAVTFALALAGAVFFAFPVWAVVAAPSAFVLVQAVRRNGVRRAGWSVLLAAFAAEATLPFTFGIRFAALLALTAPFLFSMGSLLRE